MALRLRSNWMVSFRGKMSYLSHYPFIVVRYSLYSTWLRALKCRVIGICYSVFYGEGFSDSIQLFFIECLSTERLDRTRFGNYHCLLFQGFCFRFVGPHEWNFVSNYCHYYLHAHCFSLLSSLFLIDFRQRVYIASLIWI